MTDWAPLLHAGVLAVTSLTVAILGARMLARDARSSTVLPTLQANVDALTTRLEALRDSLAEQRASDLEATRSRLAALAAEVEAAADAAAAARRIAARRKTKRERERARTAEPDEQHAPAPPRDYGVPGFVPGAPGNGEQPPPPYPVSVDDEPRATE